MESQAAVWDLQLSQEMPAAKRPRYNNTKYNRKKGYGVVSRVPRPIQDRGTPAGYYEMPDTCLIRLYGNTSSGLWQTNTDTCVQSGLTGYQGFGISVSLRDFTFQGGNGAIGFTVTKEFTDFDKKQAIFDQYKIVSYEVEMWITQTVGTSNGSMIGAPEFWIVSDPTDVVPPGSGDALLPCQGVKRMIMDPQKIFKYKVKPYIKFDVSTDRDDTGVNYAPSGTMPARYLNSANNVVPHLGLKGWTYIPTGQAQVGTYILSIKCNRVVRWKKLK